MTATDKRMTLPVLEKRDRNETHRPEAQHLEASPTQTPGDTEPVLHTKGPIAGGAVPRGDAPPATVSWAQGPRTPVPGCEGGGAAPQNEPPPSSPRS